MIPEFKWLCITIMVIVVAFFTFIGYIITHTAHTNNNHSHIQQTEVIKK